MGWGGLLATRSLERGLTWSWRRSATDDVRAISGNLRGDRKSMEKVTSAKHKSRRKYFM